MWALSKPFAAQWVADQTKPETLIKDAKTQIQRFMTLLPKLIEQLEKQTEPTEETPAPEEKSRKTAFISGAALIGVIWVIIHIYSQNI